MRTLKFKHTYASQGEILPQNPQATPGISGTAFTIEVTEIPENETQQTVCKKLNEAPLCPDWIFSLTYDQIGLNLYRWENLNEAQKAIAPDHFSRKI